MKKTIGTLIVGAGLCTGSALAAGKVYPGEGGDLASAAVWGGNFPSESDSVVIESSGTYTASSDLSINAITSTATQAIFDFTATPGRKITLNGDTGTAGVPSVLGALGEGKSLTFKGGIWHSTGNGNFRAMAHSAIRHTQPGSLTISDGCVITNINRGAFLALLNDSTVHMTGGSVIYSTGTFVGTDGGTCRNSITVDGGSWIHTGSHFYPFNAGAVDCWYWLSGVGTKQTCAVGATLYWEAVTNCTFAVTNGATVNLRGFRVGYGGYGNRLIVDGDQTSFTASELNVGAGGSENQAIFANCDTTLQSVNIGSDNGSTNNMVVVSNCTVTGLLKANWTIGKKDVAMAEGNGIRLCGNAKIVANESILTLYNGCKYVFDIPEEGYDGAPIQFQKFTYNSSNVTFVVNARDYLHAHPQGGQILLMQAKSDNWIDTSLNNGQRYLLDALDAMNRKSEQTGCTFSRVKAKVFCDLAPLPGFIVIIR